MREADQIFFLDADGDEAIPLPPRSMREGVLGKNLEDALQHLLEKHPEILPGTQISPGAEDPPRFLVLRREAPIGSWSLDHLLVDQHGVLTLVECKLIGNPEARREVIGQIVEYAAHAQDRWEIGTVREMAQAYWSTRHQDVSNVVVEKFGLDGDVEDFWSLVEDNLRRGRFRLIVAADTIRPEVRRMIEYLNQEMANVEVLGLELRCYGGGDLGRLVLVPSIIGQTQIVAEKKTSSSATTKWTPEKLIEYCKDVDSSNPLLAARLEKLVRWAVENHLFLTSTARGPSFGFKSVTGARFFGVYLPSGYVWFQPEKYSGGVPQRDVFLEAMQRLGILPEFGDLAPDADGKYLNEGFLQELSDDKFGELLTVIRMASA